MTTNIRDEYKRIRKTKYINIFLFVQLLDLFSTIIGISLFGLIEGNPILKNFSLLQLSLIKLIAVYVIIWLFYTKEFPFWFYKVIIWISVLPGIWNIFLIVLTAIL